MASPSLALPGVLFVGEDERARLVAHLGPAAGWMVPKGVLGWSSEVSVVLREALTEDVRREAKIVMPEEQIPQARMPLSHQAALKSPLVAVSSRLTQKLTDAGIRVHTVGADRVTSSFYYIGEGGTEPMVRAEGDLVAAVGAMLGERADNAAIERVLDGLVDRLVRSLSKDRITELSLELAAALPRASADGTGLQDVDLESFEKDLSELVATSEKYQAALQEIATKIGDTNERKVEIPLYVDARKSSQGPFDLEVSTEKVPLGTHDRWLLTGPLTEPTKKAPEPAPVAKAEPAKAATPAPAKAATAQTAKATTPTPAAAKPVPAPTKSPTPAPVAAKVATPAVAAPASGPGNIRPLAAPLNPPRPASNPPAQMKPADPVAEATAAKIEPAPVAIEPVVAKVEPEPVKTPEPVATKVTPEPAKVVDDTPTTPRVARAAEPLAKASSTALVPAKKGGFPILWVVIAIALAFAGYRFFLMKK